jgi:hypothetical protein
MHDKRVAQDKGSNAVPLGEQDRERTGKRLSDQNGIRGELQVGTETLEELRMSERLGRDRDDLEAHARRGRSYEVLEERAGAVETRQQDDTAPGG